MSFPKFGSCSGSINCWKGLTSILAAKGSADTISAECQHQTRMKKTVPSGEGIRRGDARGSTVYLRPQVSILGEIWKYSNWNLHKNCKKYKKSVNYKTIIKHFKQSKLTMIDKQIPATPTLTLSSLQNPLLFRTLPLKPFPFLSYYYYTILLLSPTITTKYKEVSTRLKFKYSFNWAWHCYWQTKNMKWHQESDLFGSY